MTRTTTIFWGALCAALLLFGCGEGSVGSPGGDLCSGPQDCGSDEQCDDGVCVGSGATTPTLGGGFSSPGTGTSSSDTGLQPPGTSDVTSSEEDDYQQPCSRDEDCNSEFCLRTPEGSFCSKRCNDDPQCAGELEWRCARVSEAGRDTVQICYPDTQFLCEECVADTDCGGRQDVCVGLNDGSFCGRDCNDDGLCPEGYECAGPDGEKQCVPETGYCGVCFDADFANDPQNCGSCGNVCFFEGGIASCVEGSCVLDSCRPGLANCDRDPLTGCETDLATDMAHCGSCQSECAIEGAEAACVGGACDIVSCLNERASCDENPATGCETDLLTDADHCGGCEQSCGFDNAQTECREGACAIAGCDPGYRNCDGSLSSGCESFIATDDLHCGRCDNACTGGRFCGEGECICQPGLVYFEEECQLSDDAQIKTVEARDRTQTSVRLHGDVLSPGMPYITAHGFCWFAGDERPEPEPEPTDPDPTDPDPTDPDPTDPDPSDSGGEEFSDGELACVDFGEKREPGAIVHPVFELEPGSTWTFFAWAEVGDDERIEGEEVTFRLWEEPRARTDEVEELAADSALLRGAVTRVGEPALSAHGFCWNTSGTPTVESSLCEDFGSRGTSGDMSHLAEGLQPGVQYFVRAFARNDAGTHYGESVSFQTLAAPSVSTLENVTATGETTLTLRGRIDALGNPGVEDHGVCLATSAIEIVPFAFGTDCRLLGPRSSTGTFSVTYEGLEPGRTYWFAAWARNAGGTAAGDTLETSTQRSPRVRTDGTQSLGETSVVLVGEMDRPGQPLANPWGFCISEDAGMNSPRCEVMPTVAEQGNFSRTVGGLEPGTRYYYYAFAENPVERHTGLTQTFITLQGSSISTEAAQVLSTTSARLNGRIGVLGQPPLTERGFCVGTSDEPGFDDPTARCQADPSAMGTGPFNFVMTGLEPGTPYFVRAYGRNPEGTVYGGTRSFLTWQDPILGPVTGEGTRFDRLEVSTSLTQLALPATTSHGVCVSSNPSPRASGGATCVNLGGKTTTGAFGSVVGGLSEETAYYVSAFAEGASGRFYRDGNRPSTCSVDDVPDGVDRNCDGLDGNVERAVFVRRTQSENTSSCGTQANPCATIQHAIGRANSTRNQVIIAQGIYPGTVQLANGISLYGGYDAQTWQRSESAASIIQQNATSLDMIGILAQGINQPTVVDRMTVQVGNNSVASGNTYGVFVRNSTSALVFRDMNVSAGRGGDGNNGSNGSNGGAGGNAEQGQAGCDGCSANGFGGSGGTSACAAGGRGGRGSHGRGGRGEQGIAGQFAGGLGGLDATHCDASGCRCDATRVNGQPGSPGRAGNNGSAGNGGGGGSGGTVVFGGWRGQFGNAGSAGVSGGAGSGGGGGGGGTANCRQSGPWVCLTSFDFCNNDRGGGGGGGGGGGCRGTQGSGGGSGGGSFGFFVVDSSPQIRTSTIGTGRGGDGGRGGNGGNGGGGGVGRPGGAGPDDAGPGGAGGSGGWGGGGGGGGGGAGGPSVGIYRQNAGGTTIQGNSITLGGAGNGGALGLGGINGNGVRASNGTAGSNGLATQIR